SLSQLMKLSVVPARSSARPFGHGRRAPFVGAGERRDGKQASDLAVRWCVGHGYVASYGSSAEFPQDLDPCSGDGAQFDSDGEVMETFEGTFQVESADEPGIVFPSSLTPPPFPAELCASGC